NRDFSVRRLQFGAGVWTDPVEAGAKPIECQGKLIPVRDANPGRPGQPKSQAHHGHEVVETVQVRRRALPGNPELDQFSDGRIVIKRKQNLVADPPVTILPRYVKGKLEEGSGRNRARVERRRSAPGD